MQYLRTASALREGRVIPGGLPAGIMNMRLIFVNLANSGLCGGEGPFAYSTRQHATMAALETALRAIVENSFRGDTTGYQHVEPRRIEEARKLLDSANAGGMARELAALDSDNSNDING